MADTPSIGAYGFRQFRGDRLRSFLQLAGQLERRRHGDFAEGGLLGLLGLRGAGFAVERCDVRGEGLRDAFF